MSITAGQDILAADFVDTSAGAGDSGKGVKLTGDGRLDNSVLRAKFGGDGSDGALTVASGTTDIDLGGVKIFIKNYSSISITGTGKVTFSNPHAGGTIIILKSQGDVTLTSSTSPLIELANLGGVGGNGGSSTNFGATASGGGGGASASEDGDDGTNIGQTDQAGSLGTGYGFSHPGAEELTGGQGGQNGSGGDGGNSPLFNSAYGQYVRLLLMPGSGGGGGAGANNGSGGDGGRGAGALLIECGGDLNSTGTINAAGTVGDLGTQNGAGAGGGGAAGVIMILYNGLTADSGTYTVTAGVGGNSVTGGDGGDGGTGYSVVDENISF